MSARHYVGFFWQPNGSSARSEQNGCNGLGTGEPEWLLVGITERGRNQQYSGHLAFIVRQTLLRNRKNAKGSNIITEVGVFLNLGFQR